MRENEKVETSVLLVNIDRASLLANENKTGLHLRRNLLLKVVSWGLPKPKPLDKIISALTRLLV